MFKSMAKRTLCYSVKVLSLTEITPKAAKVVSFDGSEDIIPLSQCFGQDYNRSKSEAYWIAAWILPKKNIQYSTKKEAWFDEKGKKLPNWKVEKHVPKEIKENAEIDESLKR